MVNLQCATVEEKMWWSFTNSPSAFSLKTGICGKNPFSFAGGELFMQLEREGIFMEDTAW